MIEINYIKGKLRESLKEKVILNFMDDEIEFYFWGVDNIDKENTDYELEIYLPNHYGIGTNGGGEMLVIDLETSLCYSVPFVGMSVNARIKVADSVEDIFIS